MSTQNDGGPAFPLHTPDWHERISESGYPSTGCDFTMGLSIRDYFAAKAMLGYMGPDYDMGPDLRAKEAYKLADAMLRARDA